MRVLPSPAAALNAVKPAPRGEGAEGEAFALEPEIVKPPERKPGSQSKRPAPVRAEAEVQLPPPLSPVACPLPELPVRSSPDVREDDHERPRMAEAAARVGAPRLTAAAPVRPSRSDVVPAPPPPSPETEVESLVAESGAEIRVERIEPDALRVSDLPSTLPEKEVDTLDLAEAQTGTSSQHREFLPESPAPATIDEIVEVPFDLAEHAPLPEAISVHVADPRGDWRLDLMRSSEVIDLVVHAPADVRNLLTRAESELRGSFQSTGHTMGTMDFTEHHARREEAPEWPAPRRSARPRITERVRQGRVLDRGA